MKSFTANIDNLKRVVKGEKPPGDGPPPPGPTGTDDVHVIPDDEMSDDSQDSEQIDGKDAKEDKEVKGTPSIDIKGNPQPIIDVIPGNKDTSQVTGMAGSDKKSTAPQTAEELKKALEKAQEAEATEIKGGVGTGKGMGSKRVAVPTDFPVKTDWARLMINLLQKTKVGPPSWAKAHKRTFGAKVGGMPLMVPGRDVEKDIGKIIVAIDTSGSISDTTVGKFLSELRRIFEIFKTSRGFGCKVIMWAGGPYAASNDFNIKQFNELKNWVFSNFKSGGTAIDPVVKLINSLPNLKEYVGTVWFTDGQIDDLETRLADNYNIFVIDGFQSEYTREFFADLKKYRPSKPITIVKTSYGYGS